MGKHSGVSKGRKKWAEVKERVKDNLTPAPTPEPRTDRLAPLASHHQQSERAAGKFEESFDYDDPYNERSAGSVDGVVRIKTQSEIDTEEAYEKVLKDPTSVIGERVKADDELNSRAGAGYALNQRNIREAHAKDPERMKRIAEGLGMAEPQDERGQE